MYYYKLNFKKFNYVLLVFITILVMAFRSVTYALSSPISQGEEILLKANDISYDNQGVVVASGNVEVNQLKNVLLADQIIYNSKSGEVKAFGNVSFMRDNGDIIFAEELIVQDDMTKGIASYFSARLQDNALLIAKEAKILGKNLYQLEKAAYTACTICNNKAPQWQIKADAVELNQEESRVRYKNAFFEVYGVPVLYTPYFAHASANAPRKSGFMVPKLGYISSIGRTVMVPYYFNIAPDKEAILSPIFTTQSGIVLSGKYNQLTKYGLLSFDGSITKADSDNVIINQKAKKVWRHHINGNGYFHFSDHVTGGAQLHRASDKNYLRKYKFGDQDYLTTTVFGEYYNDYSLHNIRTLHFQGLSPSANASYTPSIVPLVNSHFETEAYSNNSIFFLDSNVLSLTRKIGMHSKRISLNGGWKMPYITKRGHVLEMSGSIREDIYNISHAFNSVHNNYNKTRFIPEAKLMWKLPLINQLNNYQILLEPKIEAILAPNGKNSSKIPNEDSHNLELTDMNLFNSNHFTGLDRVEYGPRINYGINTLILGPKNTNFELFLGQNYHKKIDSMVNSSSGMITNFSDYVAKIGMKLNNVFDINYRTKVNSQDLSIRRHEIGTNFYLSRMDININYITSDKKMLIDKQQSNKQIFVNANLILNPRWKIGGNIRRNLNKKNSKTIATQGQILYNGDCIDMSYSVTRDFTQDQAINRKKSISHFINVSLKSLTN
ncbi:LPS-assembly protein LptD precursor [Rickettsiales bacterium Ac37b]|nr:LPS-assembly protein LptD precursor [Rickettsiales bacterium Ac37b]